MPLTGMDKIRPLRDAILVHRNQYNSGGADYSVTTLLDPPRVVMLNKRHLSKVDLFVEDLIHSYNGTAAHDYWEKMLMKIPNTPYEMETRLSTTINNRVVSGAFDCVYNQEDMYDMKNTSVWKVMFGSKRDWAAQQNIYRWLYYQDRQKWLKTLRIVCLFRDWSLNNKQRGGSTYPKRPCMEYRLPLWDADTTLEFMEERVNTMIAEEQTADDDLPQCSYEDMWSKPDQVAVKSTRLKKAVRVLSSMQAAKNFTKNYLKGNNCKDTIQTLSYEIRPAKRTRCESWCPVNKYCNQYHDYISAKAKGGK
jgi:hypothetical protein